MQQAPSAHVYYEPMRVPSHVVSAWLETGMGGDKELIALVEGGRDEDGSFEANPHCVAHIEAVTGVASEGELVPVLTYEQLQFAAMCKGIVSDISRSAVIKEDENRTEVVRMLCEDLGRALIDPSYFESGPKVASEEP